MILTTEIEHAKITGNTTSQEFDIGDSTLIMDFLSKKMYSNPLKIIAQEYMSNAVDANVESGNPDMPIRVVVPNSFEPIFKIIDNGIGINPDRINNVFRHFGVSTKRHTNKMLGCLGLGKLSAFSYSDSFEIRTIAKEDNNLVLRNYACIKETGKVPRIIEVGEAQIIDINDPLISDDDKHTGTTISITIKPEDFETLKQNVIEITQFWKVRPIITGSSNIPEYKNYKFEYETPKFKVGFDYDYYNRSQIVVYGGIPYPLDRNAIYQAAEKAKIYDLTSVTCVMFFDIGDLSVSINRESLHYDEHTIKTIVNRYIELKEYMKNIVEDRIKNASSFKDAMIEYNKVHSVFNNCIKIGNIEWNSILVNGCNIPVVDGYAYCYYKDNNKIRSKRVYSLPFKENVIMCKNDEDVMRKGKILTLFDRFHNIDDVQFYVFKPEKETEWESKLGKVYNEIKPILLSVIPKKVLPKISGGTAVNRSKKFMIHGCKVITNDSIDENIDVNYKEFNGVYIIDSGFNRGTFDTSKGVDFKEIQQYLEKYAPDQEVYVIPHKQFYKLKTNSSITTFSDFFSKILSEEVSNLDLTEYFKHNENTDKLFERNNPFNDVDIDYSDTCIFGKWKAHSEKLIKKSKNIKNKYDDLVNLCNKFKVNLNEDVSADETLTQLYTSGEQILSICYKVFGSNVQYYYKDFNDVTKEKVKAIIKSFVESFV